MYFFLDGIFYELIDDLEIFVMFGYLCFCYVWNEYYEWYGKWFEWCYNYLGKWCLNSLWVDFG